MAECKIERQVLKCILTIAMTLSRFAGRMEMLDRFTLHNYRIGPLSEYRVDSKLMRHAEISHRRCERRLARLHLVPESAQRRKARGDEDFVDGCVVPDPRIPPRKPARISG